MDAHADLDALVAPLRADTLSGASEVARSASEVMRRAAVRILAGSLEELRWGLGEVAMKVLDAQPSMAPLVRLVQGVLAAAGEADTVEHARHAAVDAAEAFRDGLETRETAVAERAAEVLPDSGMIGTISASSTVRAALVRSAASGAPSTSRRVLCLESRPMSEGRRLSDSLTDAGVEVVFAVDAAAFSLVPGCEAVVFGADSIGDRGVVNKVGSAALAHAAHAAGVPVYVFCDSTKILPLGFPQVIEDDRPGQEVWEEAPEGVSIWNRYFETVPLGLITAVVTDEGVLGPDEVEGMREGLPFPEFLERWAEGR